MGNYKDKNGTTRVGDFLRTIGPVGEKILGSVATLTGQPWLSQVSKAISASNELSEENKRIALDMIGQDFADLANARKHDTDIQTSEHSHWVAKVFPYLYDCVVLGVWAFITIYIIGRAIGLVEMGTEFSMTTVLGIYSGVTSMATTVMGFHRGSSRGSQLKDFIKKR